MPDAWLELDTELRKRLHDVLENPRRPLTEVEIRKLGDEGRACTLILHAELGHLQQRLDELDRDPDSSLGAIAAAFRRVSDVRTHVDELDDLLAAFEDRAKEARTTWRLQLSSPGTGRNNVS